MGLPDIKAPEYKLTLPSTNEEYTYRPFVVGEEKMLLMAMESQDQKQMVDTLRQIVNACLFEKVDANKLPMFDLEYIFLQLRSKSVGEVISMKFKCEGNDNEFVDVDVNLNDVQVIKDKNHSTAFDIAPGVGVKMRYPVFEDVEKYQEIDNDLDLGMAIIRDCMVQVYTEDEVSDVSKEPPEVVDKFVNQLTNDAFNKIINFFETMPKIRHTVKYHDPTTNSDKEVVMEGLESFFT